MAPQDRGVYKTNYPSYLLAPPYPPQHDHEHHHPHHKDSVSFLLRQILAELKGLSPLTAQEVMENCLMEGKEDDD